MVATRESVLLFLGIAAWLILVAASRSAVLFFRNCRMLSFTNCEGVSSHFRIPNRPISYWTDHRPAYLGNSFTCIQYRMCYTCPGPFFNVNSTVMSIW